MSTPASLSFHKLHAAGNDFVLIDLRQNDVAIDHLVVFLADRHFGLGCDQLLIIKTPQSTQADLRMEIFNQDGSRAEMCGNGLRAFAHYGWTNNLLKTSISTIETPAGLLQVEQLKNGQIRAQIGTPTFALADIHADPTLFGKTINDAAITLYRQHWPKFLEQGGFGVGLGNPHIVFFTQDIDQIALADIGPLIEHDPAFKQRINTEFVEILGSNHLRARIWERGAGATLACGTGACAIGVAAIKYQQLKSPLTLHLPGGKLQVSWDGTGPVYLTGPATHVASGTVNLEAYQAWEEAHHV